MFLIMAFVLSVISADSIAFFADNATASRNTLSFHQHLH